MADNDDARAKARQRVQAKRAAADSTPTGPFLKEYTPTGGLPPVSAEKTSVVFYRNGGYSVVSAFGIRHVDKRTLARPYTVCEIAVGTFVTPLRMELPAAGSTAFFKAEVDIEWEVTDPHLVAVQAVKDVAKRLTSPILERLHEVTRSYRVTDAEQANRVITRECVGGRWSDLGAELGLRVRLYVRLGVDDDAIEHAKKKRDVVAEAEVTRQRQDAFRRMLQGGELEQLSFMLAADPEGAKDFLEKIRQEGRQDDRERIDRLYTMALSGELASTDVETQVLNLINPDRRRPIQGPIGSLPPRREPRQLEPSTDGAFTPDWVSDEPPRRRPHRPEPSRDEPRRTGSGRREPYAGQDADADEPPSRARREPHRDPYSADDDAYTPRPRRRPHRPDPYSPADADYDDPRDRDRRRPHQPEPYSTTADADYDDPRDRDRDRTYRPEPYYEGDDPDYDDPRTRARRRPPRPELSSGPDPDYDEPRSPDRDRTYRPEPYYPDDDVDRERPRRRRRAEDDGWSWVEEDR
ncbi:hypothetical protein PBV52_22895 [Streptomyces sp. T12]|uniref:hypothetical protein n=2 Tax=unclassified Streptomyces TaxID=2593676 RepID=UPI002365D002|nr:hypothetical protein [Streptomyces sp. T12]WDF39445.1 hypothetical protein PBV52_22895 [Streptomyces sp. T12]